MSESSEKAVKAQLGAAAMWSQSAEAYMSNFRTTEEGRPFLDMSVGRKAVVARVVNNMTEKESPVVLDVAAAGGEPALSMAKEMPHATVHGTDFAPAMVDQIRKRGQEAGVSNLRAGLEDGQTLSGFEEGSVDAVTCTWGLESMPEGKSAINQFFRVLRNGGVAVFAAWDRDPNSIAINMIRVFSTLQGSDKPAFDLQPFGGDAGAKAMEEAGFVNVTTEKVLIPIYVPDGQGLRDVFSFMIKPTPLNVHLEDMEAAGRTGVREEACAIFESHILNDIKEGRAPTGPGLPAAGDSNGGAPAFFMKAILVEGHKNAYH